MIIRPETQNDHEAIMQVTLAAFTSGSYNPTEHLIIKGLREAGALSPAWVADMDGEIVGHVAFSDVTIYGKLQRWYGVGPISVQPDLQKQGIGSKLIEDGLARIRAMGASGCVLLGSPEYDQRFGFKSYPELIYAGAPDPKYFMALPFYNEIPNGEVEYHIAFYTRTSP